MAQGTRKFPFTISLFLSFSATIEQRLFDLYLFFSTLFFFPFFINLKHVQAEAWVESLESKFVGLHIILAGEEVVMFHIHVCGAQRTYPYQNPIDQWLSGYDGNEYSNEVMGKWFGLYKRDTQIYICFINHPVHPVHPVYPV